MKREGINTVEQLAALSKREIMQIPSLGEGGLADIELSLSKNGYSLTEKAPVIKERKKRSDMQEPKEKKSAKGVNHGKDISLKDNIQKIREAGLTPIEDANFSFRTYNTLKRHGINTMEQLASISYNDIAGARYVGPSTMNEIHTKLASNEANSVGNNSSENIILSCAENGIPFSTYHTRLRMGWSKEDAISVPVNVSRKQAKEEIAWRKLSDTAKTNNVSKALYTRRVREGWSEAEAASTPPHQRRESAPMSLAQKCKNAGISYDTYWNRLHRGWSEEDALNKPLNKRKGGN